MLDENFLDLVFGQMFKTRGKYFSTWEIHDEIEKDEKSKIHYNDVLMALEQLSIDEYINRESSRVKIE
jgi:hypothetical protein